MNVQFDAEGTALQKAAAPKEMLSVSVNADGRTHVRINFSSLSLMQECWRKVEYSLLRGLRSNLEAPATLFGSAIHSGLEVYYSSPRTQRHLPKKYLEILQMIGAGAWEDEWQSEVIFASARAFVLKAAPIAGLPPENKRSIATGVWILRHYFEQYLTDPFVILSDANGPLVEKKVSMRLHEDEKVILDIFGQIDFVLKNEITGVILPGDHKTTSQLGPQFYQRLNPNFQYTFYLWMAREVLGLETDSFLVNALQVKEMPKTSRGSGPQFARQVTTRTQDDFDELKLAIIDSVFMFLRNQERGSWPMSSPGPCSNYGGCQFHDICAAPTQLRENIIRAKYAETGHIS